MAVNFTYSVIICCTEHPDEVTLRTSELAEPPNHILRNTRRYSTIAWLKLTRMPQNVYSRGHWKQTQLQRNIPKAIALVSYPVYSLCNILPKQGTSHT